MRSLNVEESRTRIGDNLSRIVVQVGPPPRKGGIASDVVFAQTHNPEFHVICGFANSSIPRDSKVFHGDFSI
jgi:hypothetical protein